MLGMWSGNCKNLTAELLFPTMTSQLMQVLWRSPLYGLLTYLVEMDRIARGVSDIIHSSRTSHLTSLHVCDDSSIQASIFLMLCMSSMH